MGIVQGMLVDQSAGAISRPVAASVKGQVLTIDGGAYVVKEFGGRTGWETAVLPHHSRQTVKTSKPDPIQHVLPWAYLLRLPRVRLHANSPPRPVPRSSKVLGSGTAVEGNAALSRRKLS